MCSMVLSASSPAASRRSGWSPAHPRSCKECFNFNSDPQEINWLVVSKEATNLDRYVVVPLVVTLIRTDTSSSGHLQLGNRSSQPQWFFANAWSKKAATSTAGFIENGHVWECYTSWFVRVCSFNPLKNGCSSLGIIILLDGKQESFQQPTSERGEKKETFRGHTHLYHALKGHGTTCPARS